MRYIDEVDDSYTIGPIKTIAAPLVVEAADDDAMIVV